MQVRGVSSSVCPGFPVMQDSRAAVHFLCRGNGDREVGGWYADGTLSTCASGGFSD